LCAFSDMDPITRGGEANFIRVVPGAEDQPHITIEGAGHFLQEDQGPQLALVVVNWLAGCACAVGGACIAFAYDDHWCSNRGQSR
jgi:hypothetical protein